MPTFLNVKVYFETLHKSFVCKLEFEWSNLFFVKTKEMTREEDA